MINLLNPNLPPPKPQKYCLSHLEQAEVKIQVTDMIAKGWIHPSVSPYSALILFVRKKTGEYHISDVCRILSFKFKYAIGPLSSTLYIRLTWSVRPCYCIFKYWFSSCISIGTYSQVSYTQNSISYEWRPLQIHSNAIWVDKLSFNILMCHEYDIRRYVEQVCYSIFRWFSCILCK